MRWSELSSLVAIVCLLAGCGGDPGGGETSEGTDESGETTGAVDCEVDPEFTACGEAGICLAGDCVELGACVGEACTTGPTFVLADTNLRACHGPSPDGMDGTIECPGTPDAADCGSTDYCGADAQYGWDLVHDASERFSVSSTDEPVVSDTVTGLEWQRCSLGQSGSGCSGGATRVSWFDAESFCADSSWGGHEDWVLPSAYALQSITDYSRTSLAIDIETFANSPSGFAEDPNQWWIECAWSGSDYAGDANVAWAVMVNNGDISQGSGLEYHLHDKGADSWEGCYVRCVREPAPVERQRFVKLEPVAGEPVVADVTTQLIWQGCSYEQTGSDCQGAAGWLDWPSALAECQSLSWGGSDDWRLPNVKELRSIVDDRVQSPAIDSAMFPNTPHYGPGMTEQNAGHFWTATSRWYNDFALYVEFGSGFSHFYVQEEGRHVRCVRSG